ncbi:MAG: tRNA preQ1(34) S-adenosylmethionine ribosyltransferase-isomerase QueA [Deltaproteobacteria bacterium CG12_big_fil_rev_8_21_14_0_65_43_10]|nr:MAG: tRNA preQ1(34) S-adenosylmethionine ribosyltransferase-isomerase QueA [Deltaproteobacteria bacterium CG2_30_43_15]PIQ44866.1 MAG: tRNA preQ1(34) S-adenosylmethionine ribosyltransferase-isomerase QueA [Deltaproteobacteria bacterium CG12_big_fil_rev_8_21_14_0_65_43_10]PIU84973.1 MAG: tRNA preQ1(34) S-adenosylmethionine ribosyltransferase-isomerase QueA [Deltaproteobacteria bacterium CG06_land_8_20_14_3_00_44_19]PIX22653.1 MAG: tRNA preQ1(34) S-adenosylmethionine ribosyltransferase-isomeras
MRLEEFDYMLPEGLISQYPMAKRDDSRLLIVNRQDGRIEHRAFSDISYFMETGDVLVINDTRVIPARLFGKKETGGRIEILILRQLKPTEPESNGKLNIWECLIKSSKRLKEGSRISFNEYLEGEVIEKGSNGKCILQFHSKGDFHKILDKVGRMPLPPYIKRDGELKDGQIDIERYQTVFARNKGAIAAPTAGLHFTEGLLSKIQEKGVKIAYITVHIGMGTFMPVRAEKVEDHVLEAEYFEIKQDAASLINTAVTNDKRIIAVGTSVTRALESAVVENRIIKPATKYTSLFIYPGYQFKIVDTLVTNFHLPKSTPLLLVSAFAGNTLIADVYKKAIEAGYRFLSYGDGMMIL